MLTIQQMGGAPTVTLKTVTLANNNDLFGQIAGLAPAVIDYDYAHTNSITISTGAGDTVEVQGTGTTTHLIGAGDPFTQPATRINIGNNGSVKAIQGTLNIENPDSFDFITVDDSADGNKLKQAIMLGTFMPASGGSWGYVSGLAPAHINYAYSDTKSITVLTGDAPNTIDVLATGVPTNLVEPGIKGNILGFGSPNTIAIGNAGSVQGIVGTLNVENPYSFNTITVDDSVDGGQTALLSTLGTNPSDSEQNADPWGSISGLSLGNINYEYADTKSVTLMSGTADTINVSGTGTTTNIVGTALLFGLSGTTVNVGDGGTVQGIVGTLNIDNPLGFNVLTVDDSADSGGTRTATLGTFTNAHDSWGYIGGLAPARINYEYAQQSECVDRRRCRDDPRPGYRGPYQPHRLGSQ
jgi:hypothetical protein